MDAISKYCDHVAHSRRRYPIYQAGFTLVELAVVATVAGTLATAAATLAPVIDENRRTTAVNDLTLLLNLARSESIKRVRDTVVCPSDDRQQCREPSESLTDWSSGVAVFVDENQNGRLDGADIVLRHEAPPAGIRIQSSPYRPKITYRPQGTAGGSAATMTVCSRSPKLRPRYVIIANTGRVRAANRPGDGAADSRYELCGA